VEIELTPVDAAQYGYTVVIDPDDEVGECDETNNDATWADSFCR
jgi:subtilase family serine protease